MKRRYWLPVLMCLLVFFICYHIYSNSIVVEGNSMDHTLSDGDRIFVESGPKYSPSRMDLIVFRLNNEILIKRVVGLPGDKLLIDRGEVYINHIKMTFPETVQIGKRTAGYKNTMVNNYYGQQWDANSFGPVIIPFRGWRLDMDEGHNLDLYGGCYKEENPVEPGPKTRIGNWSFKENYLFVLGDNRDQSEDSRMLGFVPVKDVIGKATLVLYSEKRFGNILKHLK